MSTISTMLGSYIRPAGINQASWTLEAPDHWQRNRLKFLCRINPPRSSILRNGTPDTVSFLPMELARANDPTFEAEDRPFDSVSQGFTAFQDEDVLVAKITPCFENGKGALCQKLTNGIGFGTTEFHVLRTSGAVSAKYLYYVTHCKPFRVVGASQMKGSAGQQRVPAAFLSEFVLPIPPREDQDAIVKFLDRRLADIDRFIASKRRLIELLDEERLRDIDRVTRKGIDEAPTKNTAFEWIGEVPAHWKIAPLKYAFSSMRYGISDSGTDEGTIPVLTMGHIHSGKVTVPESGGVVAVDSSLLLENGDLLFNRTNSAELVGKVGLFRACGRDVTFASYLVRLRPRADTDPEYMNYLLNSPRILAIARQIAVPSLHQSNLNPTRYGRIHIALPPFQEQQRIATWINARHADVERAKGRCKKEIDLMNEFRASLIAEAVTGRIDVRTTT